VDVLTLFLMKLRDFSTLFAILLTQGYAGLDFSFGNKLKTKTYSALTSA